MAILVASVASLSFASAAAAGPPLQFRSHVDAVLPEPGLSAACGFAIAVHLQGTDHLAVFFDRNGALSAVIETTPGFTHTFINVATGQ